MSAQLPGIVVLFVLVAGCIDSPAAIAPGAAPQKPGGREAQRTRARPATAAFTHVVTTDVEYYTTGSQQGRPPDGTFKAGTKVRLLKEAGSYSKVRSQDGIVAFVSTSSLEKAKMGKRSRQEQPSQPDQSAVAVGTNRFALELYGRLHEQQGNLFLSPFSISTALAMVYAGAEGKTAAQMADVLNFELPADRLHSALASLRESIQHPDEEQGHRLIVANRLWAQHDYALRPDFLQVMRRDYGAEAGQVDFVRQTEAARQAINAWVEEQTERKIEDLIPPGTLDEMTRLVLTNAIYFKGDWTRPFDEQATEEAPFTVATNQQVPAPLMHQQERFPYQELDDLQILELPYGQRELSMIVLLPKQVDGLDKLESSLTAENLQEWLSGLRTRQVEVYLPKFKMSSQFQLTDALAAMGMTLVFEPGQADLSGMSSRRDLYVSAVVHKAFVDVNEEGTEAAAATGAVVGVTSAPLEPVVFRADHPFLFLIRHNATGSIVFLGRLVNPLE